MSELPTIDIRPAVSVYATYRRLSYRPWYAVAEFVDNSTQNYFDHKSALQEAFSRDDGPGRLRITIDYDPDSNKLTIVDNANGMGLEELTRAVVLDRPPPRIDGRCEYGMGLKTAACWFGDTWTIVTSRLKSRQEYTTTVHVPDLVNEKTADIPVGVVEVDPGLHYTCVVITNLHKPIRGRTIGKIKEQLGSIYRQDLRTGEIAVLWNGEPVTYDDPKFLGEDIGNGRTKTWRKDVGFDVPWHAAVETETLRATGWIGVRTPGNQRQAGFALLRRGRVVVGGPSEGYKPDEIFGQGNTFRSQRLVGELNLDDWPVTQAKDAFDWSGGLEEDFITCLKLVCHDYMEKSEAYRERGGATNVTRPAMEILSEPLRRTLSDARFGTAVEREINLPQAPLSEELQRSDIAKLRSVSRGPVLYQVPIGSDTWEFRLHWQDALTDASWMQMSAAQDDQIDIYLNMAHPFLAPYIVRNESVELIQKLVLSLALSERMARQTSTDGLISASDFRVNMNKVLRLAGEIEPEYGPR